MEGRERILEVLSDLTNALNHQEKEELLSSIEILTFRKCEIIYREGDVPRNLFCIIHGKVKVYKEGVGGRCQIVRVFKSVDFFGYRAAFSQERYVTSASAFEPTTIAAIPMTLIESLILNNPHVAMFFIRKLSDVLGKSDERTVNLTQKHIRGRLAESILYLKENYGLEEDGCTLSIYLSREDMANLSNMTTSNAIRTMSLFAQEKIIALDGRKIKIINEAELEKISRMG